MRCRPAMPSAGLAAAPPVRRWSFAAVVGLGGARAVLLPVRYLATASVIVAEQEPGDSNVSGGWAQKIGDPADLESQLLVIRSPRLMRLAMNAPGVIPAVVEECDAGGCSVAPARCESSRRTPPLRSTMSMAGSASHRPAARASSTSPTSRHCPKSRRRLANALTQTFLDDQRNEGANSREVATSWLWQELNQLDSSPRRRREDPGVPPHQGADARRLRRSRRSGYQHRPAAFAGRSRAGRSRGAAAGNQRSRRGVRDAPSVLSSRASPT